MSSEILTQNDIDHLVENPDSSAAGRRASQEGGPAVTVYDFRRPHRVSKERLRTLQAMYERYAKTIEGWIMGRVRDQVELTLVSVEQLSFNEFVLSLPTPCCSFLLEVENSGGELGVIDMGHEFSSFLVDRMMGGRGKPAMLERALTPIERLVVQRIVDRLVRGLTEVWSDYVLLGLKLDGFESIPEILRASGGNIPTLVTTLEVSAGGAKSLISICLPFVVLDSFFAEGMRPRISTSSESLEEQAARRRIAEVSLRSARLPVTVQLPTFRLSMRSLADLRPGAVLATGVPQDAEVQVLINRQPRFIAQAARVGQRLAVRILEEYPSEGPRYDIAGAMLSPS